MMQRLRRWSQEYVHEWSHKVEWPTFEQLFNSTVTVLVAMVLIAVVIGLMDVVFGGVMRFLYSLFS
ncbi:MAG: preprotein translocase subunit SecE [Bacteroidia bacterium]